MSGAFNIALAGAKQTSISQKFSIVCSERSKHFETFFFENFIFFFTLSAIPFTRRSDVFLCVVAIVDDEFVVAIQHFFNFAAFHFEAVSYCRKPLQRVKVADLIQKFEHLSLRAYALRNSSLERVQSNKKFSNANYLDYERTAERHQLQHFVLPHLGFDYDNFVQSSGRQQISVNINWHYNQMALHSGSCSFLISITLFVNNRSDNHVIVMQHEYLKKAAVLFVNRSLVLSAALPRKMHFYAGSPKMTREY
uniref:Uncharacterized protein n=1 Tax=Glossina palpalis gambiensis TaxID=67801 RepID=A0A1B0BTZ4_9MUSC